MDVSNSSSGMLDAVENLAFRDFAVMNDYKNGPSARRVVIVVHPISNSVHNHIVGRQN